MAVVELPDGSKREVADGTTVAQLAESIGRGLAKAAVAGRVDGRVVDLAHPLTGEHKVAILTDRDPDGLMVLRHSTAHVMAEAIQRLYPDAQLAYGPPLDNGFYYDIALATPPPMDSATGCTLEPSGTSRLEPSGSFTTAIVASPAKQNRPVRHRAASFASFRNRRDHRPLFTVVVVVVVMVAIG